LTISDISGYNALSPVKDFFAAAQRPEASTRNGRSLFYFAIALFVHEAMKASISAGRQPTRRTEI
jgi:hypothetical protein